MSDEVELSPREQAYQNRNKQMDYDPNDDEVVISDEIIDDGFVDDGFVEVKINGETLLVEQEKIDKAGSVENYQKKRSAEDGLQSLSNERKLFKQEQENFKKQQELFAEEQRSLSVQDGINETNVPSSDERKELVKQYHQAIYDGDDDKAAELFLQINPGMQQATPQINEDEIIEKASNRTRQQIALESRQQEQLEANAAFADNHPIIHGDDELFEMASKKTIDLQKQYPNWSPSKIIDEAATIVEKWYEGVTGNSTVNNKVAEKRKMSAVKTASGRSTPKPPPKQETNSDYITRLRKQRGLEI